MPTQKSTGSSSPHGDETDPLAHLDALHRDLALLRRDYSRAETRKDTAEAAALTEALASVQQEIQILLAEGDLRERFSAHRRESFEEWARAYDLLRLEDRVTSLTEEEGTLARSLVGKDMSSYAKRQLTRLQEERSSLQKERDQAVESDPPLALHLRSLHLREYRLQLLRTGFVLTPSRRELLSRITDLWTAGRKVLLTGPTGTGKTELLKVAARNFSGDPEILSGHQGLTSYDAYGRPVLTRATPTDAEIHDWADRIRRASDDIERDLLKETFSAQAGTRSDFTPGKLTRAATLGRPCLYDEVNLIPNDTLLRHKADFNLAPGDTFTIQEDSSRPITIQPGFVIGATANIKGPKHKDRTELPNEFVRLFDAVFIPAFSREELYDLALATLISRRGELPLARQDAEVTLKAFVDATTDIQQAYEGTTTSFYQKGGASTGKHAFLEKAVLDPGRLLAILRGWKKASLTSQTFAAYLDSELLSFVNNENYSSKDRFTLLDILTSHGFLHGHTSIKDFLPAEFTPDEWQRHQKAHPQALPETETPPLPLDPLTTASLDPYGQRSAKAADLADALLASAPAPTLTVSIDTTDLERTLKLSEQYESQLRVLRESGILQSVQGNREGIGGINNTFYPVPTLPEIRSALALQPHLPEKIAQGFTRLRLVPFGMSLDTLREKYKETLLATDASTGLKNVRGNTVALDRADPLFTWEEYADADRNGKLAYGPGEFSENHNGKTKAEMLSSGPAPRSSVSAGGWHVLLVEDLVELPREGQGQTIAARPQVACNRTATEYLEELKTNPVYRHETGLIPEAYIALAITRLREHGIVLDKETYSFLTGAYFPSPDSVPNACFHPDFHRALLSRYRPGSRFGACAVRVGVRIM